MAYIALYRKWRPKTFTDVVGQKQVSETIMRAIRENKVTHAYLFSGPRGTGKTSMAKIFARAINCEQGPTDHPCNQCKSCTSILEGSAMDVVEIDAASNRGIDEIRNLRDSTKFLPAEGRKKIFIIDEAHMLTNEAWNALLKTIEEPPDHVMFIFATTEVDKLPVTILSRCQRYAFRRISVEDMTEHILHVAKESHIDLDEGAAKLIAVQADGGLRDALSILDQCSGMTEGRITSDHVVDMMGLVGKKETLDIFEAIKNGDGVFILQAIKKALSEGREAIQIVTSLGEHLHALLLHKVMPKAGELSVYKDYEDTFAAQSDSLTVDEIEAFVGALQRIHTRVKGVDNQRLIIEMGLLEMCARQSAKKTAAQMGNLEDIAYRIEQVERKQDIDREQLRDKLHQFHRQLEDAKTMVASMPSGATTYSNFGAPSVNSNPGAPSESSVNGHFEAPFTSSVQSNQFGATKSATDEEFTTFEEFPESSGTVGVTRESAPRKAPTATPMDLPLPKKKGPRDLAKSLSQQVETKTAEPSLSTSRGFYKDDGYNHNFNGADIDTDPKDYRKYVQQYRMFMNRLQDEADGFVTSIFNIGQLLYLDDKHAVVSFRRKQVIETIRATGIVEKANKVLTETFKHPMYLKIVLTNSKEHKAYEDKLREVYDMGADKFQRGGRPSVPIPREDMVTRRPPISPFAATFEEPQGAKGLVDDVSEIAVTGFDGQPANIPQSLSVEEVALDPVPVEEFIMESIPVDEFVMESVPPDEIVKESAPSDEFVIEYLPEDFFTKEESPEAPKIVTHEGDRDFTLPDTAYPLSAEELEALDENTSIKGTLKKLIESGEYEVYAELVEADGEYAEEDNAENEVDQGERTKGNDRRDEDGKDEGRK